MSNEADLSREAYRLGCGKEIKEIEVFEAVRDALCLSVEPLFKEKCLRGIAEPLN